MAARPTAVLENNDPIAKALAVGSYFMSGCLAINVAQVLGAPLSLINPEWYNSWIAFTKQQFAVLAMTMTQRWAPTVVRVSGDASVRGQLYQTTAGDLLCLFPKRMVMIANHQIYTDWLYLWWIAYSNGMHGRIYIVLKESLKRIPVIGWGMQLSQFIFLKREWEQDRPQLARHMKNLNHSEHPMWLLLFPEGTNLAASTRGASARWAARNGIQDMKHTLLPRSTGLQFCLQELRHTVNYLYDCTIAYEGVPHGRYAQDVFTLSASYIDGKPPKRVHMYWRRFPVSQIPISDNRRFELWLRARWIEKDSLIEFFQKHGCFPADRGVSRGGDGRPKQGTGYIDATIKASQWYNFLRDSVPMGLLAMILSAFYGALPKAFQESIRQHSLFKHLNKLPEVSLHGQIVQPQEVKSVPKLGVKKSTPPSPPCPRSTAVATLHSRSAMKPSTKPSTVSQQTKPPKLGPRLTPNQPRAPFGVSASASTDTVSKKSLPGPIRQKRPTKLTQVPLKPALKRPQSSAITSTETGKLKSPIKRVQIVVNSRGLKLK